MAIDDGRKMTLVEQQLLSEHIQNHTCADNRMRCGAQPTQTSTHGNRDPVQHALHTFKRR